jgi:predicted dehydrogenase
VSSRARSNPLNTPDQALSLMKVIDGAYKSAATGKPVAL